MTYLVWMLVLKELLRMVPYVPLGYESSNIDVGLREP